MNTFYVIYCKFWELDTDHDLVVDAQDLSRHERTWYAHVYIFMVLLGVNLKKNHVGGVSDQIGYCIE